MSFNGIPFLDPDAYKIDITTLGDKKKVAAADDGMVAYQADHRCGYCGLRALKLDGRCVGCGAPK